MADHSTEDKPARTRGGSSADSAGNTEVARALMQSRKFQALLLACTVYLTPVSFVFLLVLKGLATKDDLVTITKWMGASLSPAFLGYIGGVALEDAAEKTKR